MLTCDEKYFVVFIWCTHTDCVNVGLWWVRVDINLKDDHFYSVHINKIYISLTFFWPFWRKLLSVLFKYIFPPLKHLKDRALFFWEMNQYFCFLQNQQTMHHYAAVFMQTPIHYPNLSFSSVAPLCTHNWW